MVPPLRRYYLNAGFDLEIGGFSTLSVRRAADEMTTLFIPILQDGDCAVVDVAVPDCWMDYLRSFGLAGGEVLPPGVSARAGTPVVWGWNPFAAERIAPVCADAYPPFAAVRKVNGRSFCSDCAERFGFGVPGSRFCRTIGETESLLSGHDTVFPLVVKPVFGGSGYGFRVLKNRGQWNIERSRIERLCRGGGVIVEPWLRRKYDLSTSTKISRDGAVGAVTFQRQWVNGFGAWYGSYCDPTDPVVSRWKDQLETATRAAAAEVAREGYFGPVGFDSFVYGERGKEHLAAVIEINARYTMGMLAQEIRSILSLKGPMVVRSIGRKKCVLPETMETWSTVCDEFAYDATRKIGVLPLTPPRIGFEGVWEQPQRSVFLIVGSSEEEVLLLDRELRFRLQSK